MPWNDPGKGSSNGSGNGSDKGKGQKDPWSKGSSQPPDLDEVFAGVQRKLKGLFGGGGNQQRNDKSSGGGFASFGLIIMLAVIIWLLFTTPHIVDESERGVVTRFGEFVRSAEPGLRFTWPAPLETMRKVDVKNVRSIDNSGRMLTSDENVIEVAYSVQYRITDPISYVFEVRDPDEVLFLAAESALREIIGANKLDYILETGRGPVGSDTRTLLQEIIDKYQTGIEISNLNMGEVKPPSQVKAAFDDVIKAEKDKERFVNEAEAYANKVIPEARGKAARIVQEAEGYKASQVARAEGEADRFTLQLDAYRLAPEVTRQRLYLQTMQQVLGNNNKVLLDVGSDGNILYLPIGDTAGGNRPLPPLRAAGGTTSSSSLNGVNSSSSTDSRDSGREGR